MSTLWFAEIERVEANFDMDYFSVFFHGLSPAFFGWPEHLQRMKVMLERNQDNADKTYLCKLLREQIDRLDEII